MIRRNGYRAAMTTTPPNEFEQEPGEEPVEVPDSDPGVGSDDEPRSSGGSPSSAASGPPDQPDATEPGQMPEHDTEIGA